MTLRLISLPDIIPTQKFRMVEDWRLVAICRMVLACVFFDCCVHCYCCVHCWTRRFAVERRHEIVRCDRGCCSMTTHLACQCFLANGNRSASCRRLVGGNEVKAVALPFRSEGRIVTHVETRSNIVFSNIFLWTFAWTFARTFARTLCGHGVRCPCPGVEPCPCG